MFLLIIVQQPAFFIYWTCHACQHTPSRLAHPHHPQVCLNSNFRQLPSEPMRHFPFQPFSFLPFEALLNHAWAVMLQQMARYVPFTA